MTTAISTKKAWATLDKELRDLGFARKSAYYGAQKHYEKKIELSEHTYDKGVDKKESRFWSYLVIKVEVINWSYSDGRGFSVKSVVIDQHNHHTWYDQEGNWRHSEDTGALKGGDIWNGLEWDAVDELTSTLTAIKELR